MRIEIWGSSRLERAIASLQALAEFFSWKTSMQNLDESGESVSARDNLDGDMGPKTDPEDLASKEQSDSKQKDRAWTLQHVGPPRPFSARSFDVIDWSNWTLMSLQRATAGRSKQPNVKQFWRLPESDMQPLWSQKT